MELAPEDSSATLLSPTAALTRFSANPGKLEVYHTVSEHRQRYGFCIGGMGFLLATDETVEVVEFVSACPIPNTPLWFKGMINVRGNLVPVIELKLLLDIEVNNLAKWILIVGEGNKTVGIGIDILPHVVDTENEVDELPPLPEIIQKHVSTAVLHEKDIWLDMNYEELFADLFMKLDN